MFFEYSTTPFIVHRHIGSHVMAQTFAIVLTILDDKITVQYIYCLGASIGRTTGHNR